MKLTQSRAVVASVLPLLLGACAPASGGGSSSGFFEAFPSPVLISATIDYGTNTLTIVGANLGTIPPTASFGGQAL
ncbi:MAG TPA: hypothetical protein VF768_01975, partial [Holophagaceae bacterium]